MEHFSPRSDIDSVIQHRNMEQKGNSGIVGSGSSNMDQLSIDSATNKKIQIENSINLKQRQRQRSLQAQRPHFRIDWRQLTYYQKPSSLFGQFFNKVDVSSGEDADYNNRRTHIGGQPKRILNSLDGCFKSGELSAILGPSGAGKSTFLSTLFGSKQDGAYGQTKVTWMADDLEPSTKRRSLRIASIPQNDHLLHHLSVYETLMFASKIKNATRPIVGKNFHRQNVKRVAKMLKLTDCLGTRCGKLSGGQYKRVSIGQELLSEPDVIILDEPTSGLDSMTCLTTIQTLKSIATKHPICIILTIHQPDIDVFNLFDHIYVIAQGGTAIYEGRPQNIVSTLAEVNLNVPSVNYNPARFIVENAFVGESEVADNKSTNNNNNVEDSCFSGDDEDNDDDYEDDEGEMEDIEHGKQGQKNGIRRSVLSLTEAISGKEMVGKKDKKPLLNIGIRTLDGELITSEQLAKNKDKIQQSERWSLIKRLNHIQKAKYQIRPVNASQGDNCSNGGVDGQFPGLSERESPEEGQTDSSSSSSHRSFDGKEEKSSAKSDYSSSGWSDRKVHNNHHHHESGSGCCQTGNNNRLGKAISLAYIAEGNNLDGKLSSCSLQVVNNINNQHPTSDQESTISSDEAEFVVNFTDVCSTTTSGSSKRLRLKRQFDKRLSARHNCSKQKDYPIWYHAFLLTHRTWLSIIRDPIFFGIQACMHTMIPILLALIFGSSQEEGCPRIGNFDLVEFAYSDSENMIQGTVSSIRKSIGNIGIVFFEMFVLSFSINCITALVFPLDMYVLLKEYRNGWYSLRSYFFGRTLADLPVPIVLHSIAMAILYFLTGQPHSLWRFSAIIALVILSSLVAQSVGLTVGALLMKSSQSAVLAAAGIVAPFFALSGFIVRIHTLPIVAQLAAKASYLYHLLNGFIILRYGFGRCPCRPEDFEQNNSHQIPSNLHTMASMWIGTYSNEYTDSSVMVSSASGNNKTNIDPNIDVVDKMMTAFKMANSYGHQINNCDDVLPYAMLDFDLRDQDIYWCFFMILIMLFVSRFITFTAIYYKIRSFA